MDGHQFDVLARALAVGASRRHLFGHLARLSGGIAGGGLAPRSERGATAQGNGNDNGNDRGPACREEGHPCEGNQVCCEGLVCGPSGPGAADRCTAQAEPQTECEDGCPERGAALVQGRGFRIEADCTYDEAADETECSCAAVADSGVDVAAVRLPIAAVGAEVVAGEVELACEGDARTAAYTSTSASFTVVLSGKVTAGPSTTWWCETEGELVPVSGPILVAAAEDDVSDTAGAVVVHASSCETAPADQSPFDWHRVCTAPAPNVAFVLERDGEPVDTGGKQTNRGGLVRYGRLQSGAYHLTGASDDWCHAESDNVDEQGDVVVEAGQRTQVWVFYCGETSAG